jgi:MFS superfamily sulfate permease-like transporter
MGRELSLGFWLPRFLATRALLPGSQGFSPMDANAQTRQVAVETPSVSSPATRSPTTGTSVPPPNLRADVTAGFLVFLIALPLCLGISMASGFPPIAGITTAIVGGLVSTFLGSARLTIKGPAAGLIVIVLGAVTELGQGDALTGYRRALAVGVAAAVIQILLSFARAGTIGSLMPPSVVHGMLAAIGVIIVSKQAHTLLGVSPLGKGPLPLLAEIPRSVMHANPEILVIGLCTLVVLFGLPLLPWRWAKKVPAPMVAILLAIPLGLFFDLDHQHTFSFQGHQYLVGPQYLIHLPGNLLRSLAFPDFTHLLDATSLKYVLMFTLVGSIESVLSVSAVDALDPAKCASDLDQDLRAVGIGNAIAALLGGLPMISEIVRSKANIDSGATSRRANFFHGLFLLGFVVLLPGVLHRIPLAALAGMLVYTGTRLASPAEFKRAYRIGPEQLFLFMLTLLVTLATDLLLGVGVGLLCKLALHVKDGVPLRGLLRMEMSEQRSGETLHIGVENAAVFTNVLALKRRLDRIESEVTRVVIDFSRACVVGHTVLEKLHRIADEWEGRELVLQGLEEHEPSSSHALAARKKRRPAMA